MANDEPTLGYLFESSQETLMHAKVCYIDGRYIASSNYLEELIETLQDMIERLER